MDRREFITRSGRWFLAGGLIGTSGMLVLRGKVGDPNNCFINPYCKSCRQNKSCGIVEAVTREENEKDRRK